MIVPTVSIFPYICLLQYMISVSFFVNYYIYFFCLMSQTTECCDVLLQRKGQSKLSQAHDHICFNPARQSSMAQLFIMFLLISIMKGLIMLMRCLDDLVLSVWDTAVGLQAKSCAKCVNQNQTRLLTVSCLQCEELRQQLGCGQVRREGLGGYQSLPIGPDKMQQVKQSSHCVLKISWTIKFYAPMNNTSIFHFKCSIRGISCSEFFVCLF